jgi:hypothetical protein
MSEKFHSPLFRAVALGVCYIASFAGQGKIFAQDSKDPILSEDKATAEGILLQVKKSFKDSKKATDTFLDIKDNEGGFDHMPVTSKSTLDELLRAVQQLMQEGIKGNSNAFPPTHPGGNVDATYRGATVDFTFRCTQSAKPVEIPVTCGGFKLQKYGH